MIFVTQDGELCNNDSYLLAKDNKILAIKDMTFGRARIIKQGCKYLIALIAKNRVFRAFLKKNCQESLLLTM